MSKRKRTWPVPLQEGHRNPPILGSPGRTYIGLEFEAAAAAAGFGGGPGIGFTGPYTIPEGFTATVIGAAVTGTVVTGGAGAGGGGV